MAGRRDREQKRRKSARVRAEARKTGFESKSIRLPEGVTFWTIDKAGVKSVDIMPFLAGEGNPYADKGELHFERTYWVHRSVGASGDTYVCPKKTADKRCPICDYRAKLTKDPDADEELIKDLAPKERQLWLLNDLTEMDKGLRVWDVSYHLFGKSLDARIKNSDEEDEYEYFFELDNGRTLKLGMEEKSFAGNTFYECTSIDFKTRKKQYDSDLIDELPSLDDMIIVPSYDELKKVFLQTEEEPQDDDDDDDVDDDDDEPTPTKRTGAPKKEAAPVATRRKPTKPVVEDDEDDDIPFEDDEEEMPPPKPKRKPAPPVVDDDEEEFDDEPAPLPKVKPKAKTTGKVCAACEGTKKTSRGKPCPICSKPAPVAVDDDEEEEWEDDDVLPPPPKQTKHAAAAATQKAKSAKPSAKPTVAEEDWDSNWD